MLNPHALLNLTYHRSLEKYSMPSLCIGYQHLFGFQCALLSCISLLSDHLLRPLCKVVAYYYYNSKSQPYFSAANFMTCEDSADLGHLGYSIVHLEMPQKVSYGCFWMLGRCSHLAVVIGFIICWTRSSIQDLWYHNFTLNFRNCFHLIRKFILRSMKLRRSNYIQDYFTCGISSSKRFTFHIN